MIPVPITLYSIPNEWQIILDQLAELDGELTPEIEADMKVLIDQGRGKLEDAAYAKRNLELRAEQAQAQAKIFLEEAARCNAVAERWNISADRIGQAMIPALEIVGNVKTNAGTLYLQKRTHWTFDVKTGVEWHTINPELWRQRDPELNKTVLKDWAEKGKLPDSIIALPSETVSVCFRKPKTKKEISE